VIHQYPKRNIPYAEDMGRDAVRWTFTGYVIHGDRGFPGNVLSQIAQLISALEADDAGFLIHPTLGGMLCMCDKYSYSDKRTTGGYFEFDMSFVEAGSPAMSQSFADAGAMLSNSASGAENSAVSSINQGTSSITKGGAATLTGV
jgi:prophage DNA circulation protein